MPQDTPLLLRRYLPAEQPPDERIPGGKGRETGGNEEEAPELIRRFIATPGEQLAGAGFRLAEGAARGLGGLVAAPGIALEAVGATNLGGQSLGTPIRKAGEKIAKSLEGLRPKKKAATETAAGDVAGAVGSALSFVGPTAAGSLGLQALKLAPRAASLISGVATGVAANASGGYFEALAETGDHDQAAWAAAQAQAAGASPADARRAYEDVLNETGNREQAYMAFLMQGALVGPFETLGLGGSAGKLARIMARADATTGGAISSAMAKLAIQESAQEGYGQLVANLGAHLIGYDEDRATWEGVGKAALLGGLAGIIVGGPLEVVANAEAGGKAGKPVPVSALGSVAGMGPGATAAPRTEPEPAQAPGAAAEATIAQPGPLGLSSLEEPSAPPGEAPAGEPKTVGELVRAVGAGTQRARSEHVAATSPPPGGHLEPTSTTPAAGQGPLVAAPPPDRAAGGTIATSDEGELTPELEDRGHAAQPQTGAFSVFSLGTSDEGEVHFTKPYEPAHEQDPTFRGRSERAIVRHDAGHPAIPVGHSIFRYGTAEEGIVERHRPYREGDEKDPSFAGRATEPPRFRPPLKIDPFPGLSEEDRAIEARFSESLQRDLGHYKEEYRRRFGNVLNVDNARELSSDYLRDRTKSLPVHEPGSAFIKELYREALAEPPPPGKEPTVLFTAGGTGAGKTSGIEGVPEIKKVQDTAQLVYDTNMNGYASSKKKIDQALEAGKNVQIVYVYRDPVEALVKGALPRAMRQEAQYGTGRTVPLEIHAETHTGSLETVRKLAETYRGEERVQFHVVDNSRGKGKARIVPFASVPSSGSSHGALHAALRQALEEERAQGRISESVYRGFAGAVQEERQGAGEPVRAEPERARAVEEGSPERARPPPVARKRPLTESEKRIDARLPLTEEEQRDLRHFEGSMFANWPLKEQQTIHEYVMRGGAHLDKGIVRLGPKPEPAPPPESPTEALRRGAREEIAKYRSPEERAIRALEQERRALMRKITAGKAKPADHARVKEIDRIVKPPGLPMPEDKPARPSLIAKRPGPQGTVELVSGRSLQVQYAIVNAGDLIPSHDAREGFRKNPAGDINERPYDDPVEGKPMRETVQAIAQAPKPSLLTTDTPSPIDGPPIVTERGVVLGGNARTMGVQLAYHRGGPQAETLRTAMLEAARRFGIENPESVGGQTPMLVRVVAPGEEGAPGELSRILNEGLTTAKGATTEAVSRGSKVTPEVAREIGGLLGEGTLRDALNEPAKARDIARALITAGAMTQRDLDALFDPNRGIPTTAGKQVIEDALLGSVVTDVRVLSETPPSARNALLRALPSLVTLKGRIEGFPLTLKHVAQGAAEVAQTGQPLADVLDQQVLPGIDVGWKSDPSAVGILRSLLTEKPTRFAGRFERLAQRSRELGVGQGSFLAEENLPLEEQLAAEFGALESTTSMFAFPGAVTDDLRALLRPAEPMRASAARARARPAGVPTQRWLARAVQRFVDYFEPVERMQKAIPPSLELENVYQAETLRRGRTKDRIEREIREPFLKPIQSLMRRFRLTQPEVDEFLLARHAAERNRTIAERQPSTAPLVRRLKDLEFKLARILKEGEVEPDAVEAEIDQVSEELEEKIEEFSDAGIGIGMSDAEAGEILSKVAEDPRAKAFEDLGKLVDAMHREVRKVWVAAGLESPEVVAALEERWQHYVPARTDLGEYEGASSPRRMGRPYKAALGRKTRADHPLAFSFIQAERAIAQAELNRVRRTFLNYVRAHAEELEGVVREVEVPKRRALVGGIVSEIGDPFFLGRPDVVTAREAGETVGLEVDRRYQDLAKALNYGPETVEGVTRLMGRVNRLRAALITRYRPIFWPRNLIRDVKSTWYAGQELGARFALRTARDVPRAIRALATGKGPWAEHVEAFKRSGAPISFLDVTALEDLLQRMQAEISSAGPGTLAQSRAGWRRLLETMNRVADVAENATRLSAFVHAREDLGWSAEKAAAWSKELQNFERRGLWGNHVNAWYMFANAGIQGGRRFVQALGNPMVRRTVAASFVASMVWDQMMRALGGEADDGEDWWDKVPDFEKRGNFVIMYPDGSGRRVTIPAPFVWGAFNNAGQELSAALSGDKDGWEAGASIVAGFTNALSPVGDLAGQGDTGALSAAIPDVAQPAFELAVNRDWRGKPIMPPDYGQGTPDAERFWPDADPRAIAAARWLNRHTGGTDLKSGTIDVSPESIEHVLRFFGAGVPNDIRELHDLSKKVEGRDLITSRDVPLVKSFVRTPSMFESGREQQELLRELRAEEKSYFVEDERGRRRLATPGRGPSRELALLLADGRAVAKEREVKLTTIEKLTDRARLPVLQALDLAAMRWNKRAREYLLAAPTSSALEPVSP